MKKRLLAALLAAVLVFSNVSTIFAVDIKGPYEKWQIVKVSDGDKVTMNLDDTITLEMRNQSVLNWTYDGNLLNFKRDDQENPHLGKEYQSYNHYWATLTAKKPGKAVVDGNAYNYSAKEYYKVMSFTILVNDPEVKTITAGETIQLSAIMNGTITWASDKSTVAEVDQSGNVKGISAGTAHITATDADSDVVTFTITVEDKPILLNVGDTKDFGKILTGDGWTWEIQNNENDSETHATVDQSGVVTGVKLGKTHLVATNGTETASFTISVTELQYFNTNLFDYKDGIKATKRKIAPLAGATYLDDLDLTNASTGWGPVGTGRCGACVWDGRSNEAIGFYNEAGEVVAYEKGIGLHAWDATDAQKRTAYVQVDVPEGMKYFTAVAAVNQCRGRNSNVKMQFKATAYDGSGVQVGEAFDATLGNNDGDTSFQIVNLNVEGASNIRLEILDGGNGNGSDHGVFADAKFTAGEVDQNERMESQGFNNDGVMGINDYTKELNNDDSQNLYFTGGNGDSYNKGAKQNSFTGSDAVVKGIAGSTMDGPYFQANYTEPGLFNTVANEAKDVFTNVKFPFCMDADGYYTFDSDEMDAAFDDGIGQSGATLNWYGQSAHYDGVSDADKDDRGFFPFNDTKGAETYNGNLNYWFGMDLAVDFFLMNGGYLDKPNGNEPIIFEFSGDDDVWVYVDGKLVLDLGGIHSEANGSINFGTRKITTTDESGNVVEKSLESILGSDFWYDSSHDDNDGANKLHSLEVFYLERGKNASNFKARFNLPQKDQLIVEKVLDNNFLTEEEKTELYGHDFWFRLDKDGAPFANADYVVKQNGTIITENLATLPDGTFSLKYGQEAVFILETPRQEEHIYQVTEFLKEEQNPPDGAGYWNPNKFKTDWETEKNGALVDSGRGRMAVETTVPAKEAYDRTKVDTYQYTFHNRRDTFLEDDVVVIDYDKPIDVDIFANDEVFTKRDITLSTTAGKNGTFETTPEGKIRFTPTKFLESIEKVTYTVMDVHNQPQQATVTVIPATTVYYEDDFRNEIQYTGNWTQESNTDIDAPGDGSELDEPSMEATLDIQDDGTVGAGHNYGYDSTYDDDSTFSNGSAYVVDGTGMGTCFSFEFWGTGFDIISKTDILTGKIRVVVEKGDPLTNPRPKMAARNAGDIVYRKILDTVYQTEGDGLYQIPVIHLPDLQKSATIPFAGSAYGPYKVTVYVLGATGTGEHPENNLFYLDAIRIYNPMGIDPEAEGDYALPEEAAAAYRKDHEYAPYVQEVRNLLIDKGTFDSTADETTGDPGVFGFVYVDGESGVQDVATYKKIGPNNETYLEFDDGIVTTLYADKAPDSIQIGAKAPSGAAIMELVLIPGADSGWIDGDEGYGDQSHFIYSQKVEVNTATDMYYDLKDLFVNDDGEPTVPWDELEWGQGVTLGIHYYFDWNGEIDETDTSVLSITNLKTTGVEVTCTVKPQIVRAFLAAVNAPDTLAIYDAQTEVNKNKASVTVTTSGDITGLRVTQNGKAVNVKNLTRAVLEDGAIRWTFTLNVNPNKGGSYEITALDQNGAASDPRLISASGKKGGV